MFDPVLMVGIGGLGVATIGPLVVKLIGRLRGVTAASVVSVTGLGSPIVPSRYQWTDQEISSLTWACAQIPSTVTVSELLAQMIAGDMVGETCVRLLSPVKAVRE